MQGLATQPSDVVRLEARDVLEQPQVDVARAGDPLGLRPAQSQPAVARGRLGRVVGGNAHAGIVHQSERIRKDLYPCPMRALVGVDVGGTFTDVALVHDGRLTTAKVPTTVHDQSRGVMEGIRLALERAKVEPRDVAHLGHGTTVATNALLERRGARTGFVATRGFGDLLELARQTRPELYRPCVDRPPPLPVVTATDFTITGTSKISVTTSSLPEFLADA